MHCANGIYILILCHSGTQAALSRHDGVNCRYFVFWRALVRGEHGLIAAIGDDKMPSYGRVGRRASAQLNCWMFILLCNCTNANMTSRQASMRHLNECFVCGCVAGSESKQIDGHGAYFANAKYGHGKLLKVKNLETALGAIQEIVAQGEGSSPCNPIAVELDHGRDLSHYFLFQSIVEGAYVNVSHTVHSEALPSDEVSIRWSFDHIQATGHSPGMGLFAGPQNGKTLSP